ncbi:MAG TPA: hypothetical protein VIM65_02595 [Cyclobacteriaceae bacterium]
MDSGLLTKERTILFVFVLISYGSFCQGTREGNVTTLLIKTFKSTDTDIRSFYQLIKETSYSFAHEHFLREKDSLKLDDWFYYKLLGSYVDENFPNQDQNFKALFCWYILNKSGYDIRIENSYQDILLYAYSTEDVYTTQFRKSDKTYICLNCNKPSKGMVNLSSVSLVNPQAKPFSFVINKIPNLPSHRVEEFELGYRSELVQKLLLYKIQVNITILNFLEDYPNINMNILFDTPLSPEAYNSLVPQIKTYTEGKDKIYQAMFLLEFVRKAFLLGKDDDPNSFGREKWTTPEEALYYPYLDCEDRSAIFYSLVKEILDVPMIIVDYPENEHVNIGLSFEGITEGLIYKDRKYLVCETTSKDEPFGQNKLYQKWKYKVIGEYTPKKK